MADYMYGKITFPKYAMDDENIRAIVDKEDLDLEEETDNLVTYSDEQACNGQFDKLESELEEIGIPFDRYSDGYCEISPEQRYYRPALGNTGEVDVIVNLARNFGEFIPAEKIEPLLKLPAQEFKDKVTELYNECFPAEPIEKWLARKDEIDALNS